VAAGKVNRLESNLSEHYFLLVSTVEKIFQKAQSLPEEAQEKLLRVAEELTREYPSVRSSPLTLREAAELRGKLTAWEEDWNAPGMEVYDGFLRKRRVAACSPTP